MNLIQGANLTCGLRVSLISGLDGIASADKRAEQYIVTDQTDKKGHILVVSLRTGTASPVSPLSVWEVVA